MWRMILLAGGHGLGWVLVYAGYVKTRLPWISFAATIEAYKLLPVDAVVFVARTLPWFELTLGALLVLTSMAAGALYGYSYFRRSAIAASAAKGNMMALAALSTVASALLLTFFAILVRSYQPLMTQGNITDLNTRKIVYDARTGEGGSGAPLFGPTGRVIGVTFAVFTENTASNFAVPVRYALTLLERAGWKAPEAPESEPKEASNSGPGSTHPGT